METTNVTGIIISESIRNFIIRIYSPTRELGSNAPLFDIHFPKLIGGPLEIIGVCSILEVHLEWLENLLEARGQLRL